MDAFAPAAAPHARGAHARAGRRGARENGAPVRVPPLPERSELLGEPHEHGRRAARLVGDVDLPMVPARPLEVERAPQMHVGAPPTADPFEAAREAHAPRSCGGRDRHRRTQRAASVAGPGGERPVLQARTARDAAKADVSAHVAVPQPHVDRGAAVSQHHLALGSGEAKAPAPVGLWADIELGLPQPAVVEVEPAHLDLEAGHSKLERARRARVVEAQAPLFGDRLGRALVDDPCDPIRAGTAAAAAGATRKSPTSDAAAPRAQNREDLQCDR